MKKLLLLFTIFISSIAINAQTISGVLTSNAITCNGGQGTITVTTDAPAFVVYDVFTYNSFMNMWQPFGSGQTFSQTPDITLANLFSGNYKVRTYNNLGDITDSITHLLDQPQPLSLSSSSSTPVTCFNGNDGSASLVLQGGTMPYTYLWSDGSTTDAVSNLSAGNYSCIISDMNSCTSISNPISITITQPSSGLNNSTALFTQFNVDCFGDSTGAVYLNPQGGAQPYSYEWFGLPPNTPNFLDQITNVPVGVYQVVVTDANGCTESSSNPLLNDTSNYTITQPSAPVSASETKDDVICRGGSTGSIVLSPSGGTAPAGAYSYLWNNGQTTQSINNLTAGIYNYSITDAKGCTFSDTVEVFQPLTVLSSTTSFDSVLCNGTQTGTISVSVNGGVSPYTYVWSNGATTSSYNNVFAGTYTVSITDDLGCNISDAVTVLEPLPISNFFSGDSITCPFGNDGVLISNVSGGTPPYNYTWSSNDPNFTLSGPISNFFNDSTIDQLHLGSYTVVIDDANLCSSTHTYLLGSPDQINISASVTDIECFGDNSGSIDLNVIGATPPFTYVWNNGQTTSLISSLNSGTYIVTVQDANGCYGPLGNATVSFSVDELASAPISVSATLTDVICNGEANGTASLTPTGGTAPYTYLWNTGETVSSLSNLSVGQYTVLVQDAFLCQHTVTFNIDEPTPLTLVESYNDPQCNGYNDGTANVVASGGNSPYTYLWTTNSNTSNGHTGPSVNGLSPGPISVTVTDNSGLCNASVFFQIGEPSPIVVSVTKIDNLCNGYSTGSANTQVSDPGNAPFTYLWSTGETTPNIATLSSGTYDLIVTNSVGCQQNEFFLNGGSNTTTSFDILEPNALSFNPTILPISVTGANDGSVSVSPSGGLAPYEYTWTYSASSSFTNTNSSINNLSPGYYYLEVADANGCLQLDTFLFNEPNCNLTINSNYLPPLCADSNAQLFQWNISGGVLPYVSELIDGNGTFWYGPNSGNPQPTFNGTLPTGFYTLNVSDQAGCLQTMNLSVVDPDSISIDFNATNLSCFGNNSGSLSAIASGGTPSSGTPYTYLWSPNNQTSFNINNLSAGTYSVIVTDDNNCQKQDSYTITQPSQFIIDSMTSSIISCNPGVDGQASVYASGGTQPFSYIWTIPNSGIPQTTQTAYNLSIAGNYAVQVTDNNGCIIVDNINVNNAPNLILIDSVIQPLCYNDTNGMIYALASGGTFPYTYNWSINGQPGSYSSNDFIANLGASVYSVVVEDSYGCVEQFSKQIINPSLLNISLSPINVSLNGANDGSITSLVSGGIGSYSYSWTSPNGYSSTQANISNLFADTYTLTAVDGNGCATTVVQQINEPACNLNFNTTATYVTQPLCFQQSGSITWMANGGGVSLSTTIINNVTGTIFYSSSTSPNQSISHSLLDGSYNLQVTDEYGCSDILNFVISSPNPLTANVVTDSVNCYGGTDGSMLIQAIGGTSPYSYDYGTSPITGAPINQNQLAQGTYIISLTDDNGCSSFPSNFSVQIFEPAQLSVSHTSTPVTCYGGIDGEISLTVNGGTGPYFYNWTPPSGAPAIPSTPIVSGLTSNIYFVEVSDVNGCSTDPNITTINVLGPQNNLAININVVDALCFGNNDGEAQAFPIGGTPPYSYEWSDGQTSQIATSLSAGSYTCIVTDANGCINSALAIVGEPNAIHVNLSTTGVSCFGLNDGSAVVNPTGGSGTGFSVEWNINIPFTIPQVPYTSLSVPNISPGAYTVTITDFSLPGCDVDTSVLITQPDILQITPNVEQIVTCFQGSDGSLSVNTIGGTTPYSYNWSSASNNSVATTKIASNLSSQMYYVEVTDSNGCIITDSIFLASNSQLIPNITFDNVSCYGGSDGIAYSNPTGGIGPYSYNWSFTGSTNSSSSGLSANTTYSVQITDNNGCETDPLNTFFLVPQPDSIFMSVSIDSVSCFMGTDGMISIDSINGAVGPYSYQWSNGQTNSFANNLVAGSYSVVVTDDLGCVDSSYTYTVFDPTQVISNITITTNYNGSNITCFNDSTGELTVSATGGTGSYSYLWSTGETTSSIDNLNAGLYTCTISDIYGCDDISQITLVNPDTIHFNYSVSDYNGNNISCINENDGTLDVNITGGSGINFSSIVWTSSNPSFGSNNIINDTTLINLFAGTYSVTVSDFNGCSSTSFITLTEPDVLSNYFTADSIGCNGGNDGIAYSNVSGGTAPYSYSWTISTSDSSSAHGLTANTQYQLSVQDFNGCPILLDTVEIYQPDPIFLSTISILPSCNGQNDGEILIDSISGATPGYTYLWSDGQTGTIINNLYGDSIYSCVVTDSRNCQDSSFFVYLPQPAILVADINITTDYNGTSIECFGDTNASVLASATGGSGIGTYTYEWFLQGQSIGLSSTLNNLGAGTYVVEIIDTNGCNDIENVEILNPSPISISHTVSDYNGSNISCSDSLDGFINTVISGGNGIDTTSILWNTGQTVPSISNLNAGIYHLTVSDINGCVDSLIINLTQPNPISLSFSVDSVTCFGGNDGAALVSPSGGISPYLISWSTGSVNDSIFGLNGITNYIVQVSDTNNCPMVLDTISIPQPNQIQTTEVITLPTCYGINDGQIIITNVSGASGPYTYLWNDSFSSTGTILPNLNSGEYICTITDALGCTEDVLFLVDTVFSVVASTSILSDYNGTDVECYGDTNASIFASATGGTLPYTFNWTSGHTTDVVNNLGAGAYTVVVTDANGCHDHSGVTVHNPDSISASIQVSNYNGYAISCEGLSDGSATAVISGGNGIDYNTLLWNTGNTIVTLNNLTAGTYSYTIQDNNGCSSDAIVTLSSPPIMQLSLSSDSLLCYGDDDATAFIDTLINGISPYNYIWNNGQTSANATNLISGTYSLIITDDNNCSDSSTVEIFQPDSLISNLSITSSYNGYDISCYGSLDASVNISTNGGVSPYLYSLDSVYFSNTSNYNNLGVGVFNLITRDNNNCVINNSITINSPDELLANFDVITDPTCNGINDGVLTSLTSGGTGIYSYGWSNGGSTTNIINSLSIGTYSVVISDNNGCSITDSIELFPVFVLNSNVTTTQVSCTGGSDGSANIIMLGGSNPYTFSWSNGLNTANITGLSAGNYNLTVTDSSGCVLTDSIEITESSTALAFTSSISNLVCNGDNSGSISSFVSGGAGGYTYNWSTGDTMSSISNLAAGTYTLSVTDLVGCVVTDTFVVTEPLEITYTLSSNDISCFGLSDGSTDLIVTGGTLPYNYSWTGPGNYTSTNSTLNFIGEGMYNLIVTDAHGCFIADSTFVSEPSPLTSVVSHIDPLCHNSLDGSIHIYVEGGISPYTSTYGLLNQTSILGDSIIYQNLASGSNTLSVFDANNCENTYTVTLINPLELVIDNILTNAPSCYNYSNGTASIEVVGGTLPYEYQLFDNNNNVLTGSSNTNSLSSGSYQYFVTDVNGCDNTLSFTINNPDEISINPIAVTNVNCFGDNTGNLEVTVSNNSGPYQIVWMPSQFNSNTEVISDLLAGKYEAVVVDELGCTKVDSFFIEENDEIEIDLSVINSSCKLNADGQIVIDNIIGGVGPYNIYNNSVLVDSDILNSFVIESLITTAEINPYNLIVSDNYNCEYSTTVDVGFDGGYGCIDEPVVITPNYDNYNDEWIPILDLDINIEVEILNRWGQKEFYYRGNSLAFSWNGLANWGGERELPSSDYYYIIKFNNDNYPAKTGVITLIR